MTPPKAERPFQGGGCSRYDRPLTNPETISAERAPLDRADLLDPDVASTIDRLWSNESAFVDKLQLLDAVHEQAEHRRQAS